MVGSEEPPYFPGECMGSRQFYEDQRGGREIHAALVMDLVGHDVSIHSSLFENVPVPGAVSKLPFIGDLDVSLPVLHPLLFVTGAETHPELRGVAEEAGAAKGLRIAHTLNRYIGDVSDHGIFRKNGVPYFFLSCGQWAHYHMPTDTPDRLNYHKMERIGEQVCRMLAALDRRELARGEARESFTDTLSLETRTMEKAFGPFWHFLIKRAGLIGIRGRKDMDRLVKSIINIGM